MVETSVKLQCFLKAAQTVAMDVLEAIPLLKHTSQS